MLYFTIISSRIGQAIGLTSLSFSLMGLLAHPAEASNLSINEVYVFGDSNVDTGRVYQATNQTFPSSPPYFDGRFTNGLVWTEYLTQSLGLTPDPKTNFAFGGATTGTVNTVSSSFPGLLTQIDQYTNTIEANHQTANPNGLYVLAAGVNDYLFNSVTDPTVPVNNLATAITTLSNIGAKNIMVTSIIDLGQTPFVKGTPDETMLSDLSLAHRSLLADRLEDIEQTLDPDIHIFLVDTYSGLNAIQANPSDFGLTNITDACFSSSNPVVICDNPNEFFFWDTLHPSTAAQQIIGQFALDILQSESTPEPTGLWGLLLFPGLVLGGYRRSKR